MTNLNDPHASGPVDNRWTRFTPALRLAVSRPPFLPPPADGMASTAWTRHVAAAQAMWTRLTAAELLQTDGHVELLAGLIRDRYSLSRAEADQQVRRFQFEQCD